MMKTKHFIITLCLVAFAAFSAQSQEYKSAIGLRLGYPASISYKTFISEPGAVEAFLGFRSYSLYRWINIGATYQHHMPIQSVEGLKWYFGGGASVFLWSYDNAFADQDAAKTSFGLLGTLGLDYKFADIPLNLSVDWMPVFFLNGYGNGFYGGYGALSARYVLK